MLRDVGNTERQAAPRFRCLPTKCLLDQTRRVSSRRFKSHQGRRYESHDRKTPLAHAYEIYEDQCSGQRTGSNDTAQFLLLLASKERELLDSRCSHRSSHMQSYCDWIALGLYHHITGSEIDLTIMVAVTGLFSSRATAASAAPNASSGAAASAATSGGGPPNMVVHRGCAKPLPVTASQSNSPRQVLSFANKRHPAGTSSPLASSLWAVWGLERRHPRQFGTASNKEAQPHEIRVAHDKSEGSHRIHGSKALDLIHETAKILPETPEISRGIAPTRHCIPKIPFPYHKKQTGKLGALPRQLQLLLCSRHWGGGNR